MNLKPSFEWVIKWLQLELSLLWLMASLPSSFTILQNKYVDYPGDFILGALFPIHRRGSGNDVCGEIQVRCTQFPLRRYDNEINISPRCNTF